MCVQKLKEYRMFKHFIGNVLFSVRKLQLIIVRSRKDIFDNGLVVRKEYRLRFVSKFHTKIVMFFFCFSLFKRRRKTKQILFTFNVSFLNFAGHYFSIKKKRSHARRISIVYCVLRKKHASLELTVLNINNDN